MNRAESSSAYQDGSHAGPTYGLAAFASALAYEDIPADVVERTKACVLDALGCVLFGVTLPWTGMLIDLVREEGGKPWVVVPGTGMKATPRQAVLIAATAGHGFELDDMHAAAHLHCGSLAIPAALAIGTAYGPTDGRTFLAAIVAGYEVGLRVGLAATGELFMRGHHFQGTCGVFVAAATAARLLGLDAERTRHALGIAGSFGSGLMAAQEGAMSKRLHSGHAGEMGVTAALLAARGMTGIPNVLEAPYGGFLSTLSGAPDLALLDAGLGVEWEMRQVGYKMFASAASTHSVLHAIDRLMDENGLAKDDIARIHIHCSTMAHRHCAWPYRPDGVTTAQMNMFYTAAVMVTDRAVLADQFAENRLGDPAVMDMIGRIEIEADPAYDAGGDLTRHQSRVRLELRDGRVLEREVLKRPGSPENPMDERARRAKFEMLSGAVLTQERSLAVAAAVQDLESLGDMEELASLLVANK